jgi:hypothetical protein
MCAETLNDSNISLAMTWAFCVGQANLIGKSRNVARAQPMTFAQCRRNGLNLEAISTLSLSVVPAPALHSEWGLTGQLASRCALVAVRRSAGQSPAAAAHCGAMWAPSWSPDDARVLEGDPGQKRTHDYGGPLLVLARLVAATGGWAGALLAGLGFELVPAPIVAQDALH